MWSQSASAVTSPTASANPPKSAESTEGAIFSIVDEPTAPASAVGVLFPQPLARGEPYAAAPVGRRHRPLPGRLHRDELDGPRPAGHHDTAGVAGVGDGARPRPTVTAGGGP